MQGANHHARFLPRLLAIACIWVFFSHPAAAEQKELCPGLLLRGESIPSLSDTETRLVCGDPKSDAWRQIPFNQARYNLRNFLQERGYFQPVFSLSVSQVIVEIGKPSHVTKVSTRGAPDSLRIERRRGVIGSVITPSLLSSLEGWVVDRLEAEGYPCPEVRSEADPVTGEVRVTIKPGPALDLVSIFEEGLPGVEPGILRRYDAFRLGKTYNGDFLVVSSNRAIQEGVVDSSYFTARCEPRGAVAKQDLIVAPPRLLSAGFGLNTEELIIARVTWRNVRLGRMASHFDVTMLATAKQQSLTTSLNWYFFPFVSRRSMKPLLELKHENRDAYETLASRAQLAHFSTWDSQRLAASLLIGPVLDLVRTFRGPAEKGNSHFLSLETQLGLRSHYFEFFRNNPRAGFNLNATIDLNTEALLSSVSAQRLKTRGEVLWNFKEYDPPLWILGLRGGASTTVTSERPGATTRLPPTFFQYLGGSTDLRGFGYQELPRSGTGALSSLFLGVESRWSSILPLNVEPLAFFDAGALGNSPWSLDAPLYFSPGVGVRWATAFGVLRTTLARGYPEDGSAKWQFYLSLGEEF